MQTFDKSARSRLSAIGLGLLAIGGLAGATGVLAAAAMAQETKSGSEAFAKAFGETKTLLGARKYSEALPKIDAAAAAAKSAQERNAVAAARVIAYSGLRKNAELIKAIETHQAMGGLPASQLRNYKEMLAGAHDALGNRDKAMQLTKELVGEGGGTSLQLAYISRASLASKKYDDAISYANKAIGQARKEGKSPDAKHYNILLNAYQATGKKDQYYATLERAAPIFNLETYWRPLVEKAKSEPRFKSDESLLDVYRTLEGVGAKLKDTEKLEMADMAFNRKMTIETERLMAPMVKAGTIGGKSDPKGERNKKMYDSVVAGAKAEKAGGLEKAEKDAATKQTGDAFVAAGEGYFTNGNYPKAVELIQKGIDKGSLEPGALELAKLRLGLAQFKAGKKEDARKTWATVKGDNGSGQLAKIWLLFSKA